MQIPEAHSEEVRQFVEDFGQVTAAWVRKGVHTRAEVAEWKEIISRDMQNEISVNPAIDPRPQGERIRAWCKTFAKLANKMDSKK
jgi:hypothetical protein